MLPIGDDNSNRRSRPIITYILILLNIAVFLYELANGALASEFSPLLNVFAAHGDEIRQGQALYTLVTSTFLHAGWMHLLGNMLYLWIFGDNVEDALGHWTYLGFYLLGGIVAGLVSTYMSGVSHVPNLGASGAIAAVLGAYLVLFPGRRVRVIGFIGIIGIGYIPAIIVIAFWAFLQFLNGLNVIGATTGGVGYWAHIGGFMFGLAVGLMSRVVVRRQARIA